MSPGPGRHPTPIRVVAAIIERHGRLLVCRRPEHKRHGGLWEFPGGKVEPGESHADALRRELREELAVEVVDVGEVVFSRADPGSPFVIDFVPVTIEGEPRALEHSALAWVAPEGLGDYALAPSDWEFVGARGTGEGTGTGRGGGTGGVR